MRIAASFPIVLFSAILLGQTASTNKPSDTIPPGSQPDHTWTLQERSKWSAGATQAPQVPFTAAELRAEQSTTWVFTPVIAPCPIDMHVRQRAAQRTPILTRDGRTVDLVDAHLQMSLRDPSPDKSAHRMVKATVTVHGLNGRDHMMGLNAEHESDYRVARTLNVSLDAGDPSEVTAELLLPGFTATTSVDLQSVTWDDGWVWSIPGSHCRVQPDPLMLITAR